MLSQMRFILPAAALFLLAAQEEKVKLELKARKGDAYTTAVTESTDGKVQVAGQEFPIKEKEVLKYEDEVLEVEGNEATRVRRKVVEWTKAAQEDPEAPAEKQPRLLQGKTIVLKKNGDKTEYEGVEGIGASELKKHQLRADAFLTNLPKEAVGVGHEWKLDEKRLLEEFNEGPDEGPVEFKSARGGAKLEKLEDHGGVRCGVIAVDVAGEGQIKEQMDVKLVFKMKVRITLALESGRILTMKGSGTGDMTGEVAALGGEKAKLSGTFAFALETETLHK